MAARGRQEEGERLTILRLRQQRQAMPRWRAVGAFMVSLGSRRGIGGKGDGLGVFKYHRALIYTSRSAPSCRNAPNWDRASCQVLPSLSSSSRLSHITIQIRSLFLAPAPRHLVPLTPS